MDLSITEAAKTGDILLILTTDESQPSVWEEEIAPGVAAGNVLVWSSGYNVSYDLIAPPPDVDVVMVAPRMTGTMVRELFEHGKGAMAQIAIHQDASGKAREIMMALAKKRNWIFSPNRWSGPGSLPGSKNALPWAWNRGSPRN